MINRRVEGVKKGDSNRRHTSVTTTTTSVYLKASTPQNTHPATRRRRRRTKRRDKRRLNPSRRPKTKPERSRAEAPVGRLRRCVNTRTLAVACALTRPSRCQRRQRRLLERRPPSRWRHLDAGGRRHRRVTNRICRLLQDGDHKPHHHPLPMTTTIVVVVVIAVFDDE